MLIQHHAMPAAGSSSATRSAAAEQIAAITAAHPSQLPFILRKVAAAPIETPVQPCTCPAQSGTAPISGRCMSRALADSADMLRIRAQVHERLQSNAWEARRAAGECLGHIAAHCRHHTAADLQAAAALSSASDPAAAPDVQQTTDGTLLSFSRFSIEQVLQRGMLLLASGGKVNRFLDTHSTL